MAWWRVTLTRSMIGMPQTIRRTLVAMGLAKRMRVRYLDINAKNAGSILKVKELVKVEQVDQKRSIAEERASRRPPKGYIVE